MTCSAATFPRATTLDQFNRTDANPIGGNWSQLNSGSGAPVQNSGLKLASNQVTNPTAGIGGWIYYNAGTFTAPLEISITLAGWTTNNTTQGFAVYGGIQSPTSNPSMYMAYIELVQNGAAAAIITLARLYRYGGSNAWNFVSPALFPAPVAGTTKLGLRLVNRWVEGWIYDSDRGWWRWAAANDDTLTGGGVTALGNGTGNVGFGTLGSISVGVGANKFDDCIASAITLSGTNTDDFISAGGVVRDMVAEQTWQAPPCFGFGGGSGGSGGGSGAGKVLGGQAAGGVAIW